MADKNGVKQGKVNVLVGCVDAVLRDALDRVDVHPCDEENDEIKAKGLSAEMRALYEQRQLLTAPNAKITSGESRKGA